MKLKKGFTLIELLVVIAVVGVLAVIIIAQLGRAREKAKVAHFVAQLDQVEKAFVYTYFDENRSTWWTESELGIFNPTLSQIVAINSGPLSGFSTWYKNSPVNFLADAEYRFDNDGDTFGECTFSGPAFTGVNMLVYGIPFNQIEAVDEFLDGAPEDFDNDGVLDGDICGKIRYQTSAVTGEPLLIYSIDLDSEA